MDAVMSTRTLWRWIVGFLLIAVGVALVGLSVPAIAFTDADGARNGAAFGFIFLLLAALVIPLGMLLLWRRAARPY